MNRRERTLEEIITLQDNAIQALSQAADALKLALQIMQEARDEQGHRNPMQFWPHNPPNTFIVPSPFPSQGLTGQIAYYNNIDPNLNKLTGKNYGLMPVNGTAGLAQVKTTSGTLNPAASLDYAVQLKEKMKEYTEKFNEIQTGVGKQIN